MNASELIQLYDEMRPNTISPEMKMKWLKRVERMIMDEVILTHECPQDLKDRFASYFPVAPEGTPEAMAKRQAVALPWEKVYHQHENPWKDFMKEKYFDDFDYFTEMLAQEPYEELYIFYMDMQAAFASNETKRYNACANLYAAALNSFRGYWNRTYMPLSGRKFYTQHDVL